MLDDQDGTDIIDMVHIDFTRHRWHIRLQGRKKVLVS
jgi:hypothetical protein